MAAMETEPNNLTTLANSDDRNYFYGTLTNPAPSLDVDVYSFSVTDGDLVFVSLDADPLRNNTPINAKLELLDDFGNVLVTVNDVNSGSNTNEDTGFYSIRPNFPGESLVYRCPAEGTYFVRVSIGTASTGSSGAGDYLLSISRNCTIGSLGEKRSPAMTDLILTSPIGEGGVATLSGTLSDFDTGEWLRMEVSWGDGATNVLHYSGGLFPFSLTHAYPDDGPSATDSDNYPVHLWVTDSQDHSAASLLSVTVTNVPPRLSDVSVTTPILSGTGATLTGAIVDAGALDTFKLTLNWGDGAAPQVLNYPAGTTNFSESHLFNLGNTNFTIGILLADDDTGTDTGSVVVHVRQRPEPARFVAISHEANGHMLLQLEGTPEGTYRIEISSDLQTWSELGSGVARSDGRFEFEDTAPATQTRFYRAAVVN
jgi:hypothetical protein